SSYTELETLPNIDINIKEGNSLISRFDLHDKEANILDSTRQKIRLATVKYKEQVFIYKSTNDKATKDAARKNIKQIKDSFALMANPIDKEYKRLKELENSLVQEVLSFDRESVEHWNKKRKKDQDEYDKLKIEYDNKLKTLYHNAFEWRFEFPEVLNDDGKFVGFDIVIGNPPYGVEFSLDEKNIFKQKFISNIGEFEAYTFFIEIALKYITNSKGILSFITSNTWFYLDKFFPLRKDIILNCSLDTLIELEKQVFTDAPDIVPAIFSINKTESTKSTKLFKAESTQRIYDLTDFNLFTKNVVPQKIFLHSKSCILNTKIDLKKDSLLEKLAAFLPIKNYYKVVYGIKTGDNKSNLSIDIKKSGNWRKCASSANNISKYVINWKGDYLNVGPHLDGLNNINYEQPKILIQYIRKISMPIRLVCALDNEGEYYPLNNFSFIISDKGNSLAFLLGILNSKLMNWYFANTYIDYNIKPKYIEQLPFNMNKVIQKPIEKMINKIIGLKMNIPDSDTNKLESEIDKLVYQLYGLTEEEIKIVEGNG
ncbi:MAG: Eco57I restriction-modification methylase domain-containing protein, partial [Bacteroidetes bacterium]|nr:Eco57I restriction-modification methylase domain-containing protein [Bacteroidota bacterium]